MRTFQANGEAIVPPLPGYATASDLGDPRLGRDPWFEKRCCSEISTIVNAIIMQLYLKNKIFYNLEYIITKHTDTTKYRPGVSAFLFLTTPLLRFKTSKSIASLLF